MTNLSIGFPKLCILSEQRGTWWINDQTNMLTTFRIMQLLGFNADLDPVFLGK